MRGQRPERYGQQVVAAKVFSVPAVRAGERSRERKQEWEPERKQKMLPGKLQQLTLGPMVVHQLGLWLMGAALVAAALLALGLMMVDGFGVGALVGGPWELKLVAGLFLVLQLMAVLLAYHVWGCDVRLAALLAPGHLLENLSVPAATFVDWLFSYLGLWPAAARLRGAEVGTHTPPGSPLPPAADSPPFGAKNAPPWQAARRLP